MDFLLYGDLNYWLIIIPILALSGMFNINLNQNLKNFQDRHYHKSFWKRDCRKNVK